MCRSYRFLFFLLIALLVEPRFSIGEELRKKPMSVPDCPELLQSQFLEQPEIYHSAAIYKIVKEVDPGAENPRTHLMVEETREWNLKSLAQKYNRRSPINRMLKWHRFYLDRYFELLYEQRGFTNERVRRFQALEKNIPVYRQRIFVQESGVTGDVIGIVRIVDGSKKVSAQIRPKQEVDNVKTLLYPTYESFEDGDYFLPYERSVESRGVKSDLVEELRNQSAGSKVFEIGRAYRQKGTVQGEEAKAFWEILASILVTDLGKDEAGTLVIHTDRQGAILFQRMYGAKIKEAVIPKLNSSSNEPKINLRRQDRILPDDPADAEYALVLPGRVFAENVLKSFESNPLKAKMLAEMSWLSFQMKWLKYLLNR